VAERNAWESPSLEWVHRVREEHYQKTKGTPVEVWLKPANPRKVAEAFRRLGLKVRLVEPRRRSTFQRERKMTK